MNAMTAQDYTLYPFSTTHTVDYENLLRVYLDATFFPLLQTRTTSVRRATASSSTLKGQADHQGGGVQRDEGGHE